MAAGQASYDVIHPGTSGRRVVARVVGVDARQVVGNANCKLSFCQAAWNTWDADYSDQ